MLRSASFTCLDACCCDGLRLAVYNKKTPYLLTYFQIKRSQYSNKEAHLNGSALLQLN